MTNPSPTQPYRGLKWSFSRQGTLNDCPHRYYLNYYGWRPDAGPDHGRIHGLKRATGRHMRAGSIAHWAIEWWLRQSRQRAPLVSGPQLAASAVKKLRRDQHVSQDFLLGVEITRPSRQTGKEQDDPVLLIEYAVGLPDADARLDEVAETLTDALRRFLDDPALAPYRRAATQRDARIEGQQKISVAPSDDGPERAEAIPITVKLDLVYRTEDGVDIVDWKTGRNDPEPAGTLQIGGYVLWATRALRVRPETVRFVTVHLATGAINETRLSEAEVYAAEDLIWTQTVEMRRRHVEGLAGDESAFPKNPERRRCRACNFLLICEEGKAVAGHDLTYPGLIHLTPVTAG